MAHALAVALARRARVDDPLDDAEIDRLIAQEHLTVEETEFPTRRLVEVTCLGHVFVDRRLSRRWHRWLVLHALAHHLLDGDERLSLYCPRDRLRRRAERRADKVAGWLHFARYVQSHAALDPREMADWADVPEECAARWLVLAEGEIREMREV